MIAFCFVIILMESVEEEEEEGGKKKKKIYIPLFIREKFYLENYKQIPINNNRNEKNN